MSSSDITAVIVAIGYMAWLGLWFFVGQVVTREA